MFQNINYTSTKNIIDNKQKTKFNHFEARLTILIFATLLKYSNENILQLVKTIH